MDNCQEFFIRLKGSIGKVCLAAALAVALPGCVLSSAAPPPAWPPPPPPPPSHPRALALYLLLGLLLVSLLWVGIMARRAWLRGGGLAALDREDAALLRTARDALSYLLRRRLARLRPLSRH